MKIKMELLRMYVGFVMDFMNKLLLFNFKIKMMKTIFIIINKNYKFIFIFSLLIILLGCLKLIVKNYKFLNLS